MLKILGLQGGSVLISAVSWFYADSKASKCDFSDTVNCDAKDKKESRLFCSHLLLSLYIWFPGSASLRYCRKSFSSFLKDNLTICRHFVNIKAYALCHPADTIFPERKPFLLKRFWNRNFCWTSIQFAFLIKKVVIL